MNRRQFITGTSIAAFALWAQKGWAVDIFGIGKKDTAKQNFPFQLSDKEWKERLTPEQYRILRKEGTEHANSSPLNNIKGKGMFRCAGCDHPLFSATTKFDSGTGWPSFYQPANAQSVGTATDYKLVLPRTEVHCANCGGHLGHVFKDGPKPTGLRYCINGAALTYKE